MSYHPRIETEDLACLGTVRSRNSELWFVNNPKLEEATLGYVARYRERYGVNLYAFGIEGSHIHDLSLFPKGQRAAFHLDVNSTVARAVKRYVSNFPGGKLWARRYSNEFVPSAEDIERYFFYIVLQPVKDGLVDRISDYPGYNCFHDAVHGIDRKFTVVNWAAYNERRRWKAQVNIKDYIEEVSLTYTRLPGYEHLSQKEYAKLMYRKLEERRLEVIAERGHPCMSPAKLRAIRPGSLPRNPKVSERYSHRPRVLCSCPNLRSQVLAWYFDIYSDYRESSERYRAGELNVEFPPGTYRPWVFTANAPPTEF